jgi:dipeptidyl aminopeptidase/acylaminoacyl peptidase
MVRERANGWASRAATGPLVRDSRNGLRVFVRQNANTPPSLVALLGHRELTLVSQDPALSSVRRAPVEEFKWKEEGGTDVVGSLILPVRFHQESRVPLIIQVSAHTDMGLFLPDGPVSAGYASQLFAAEGFAVLNVPWFNVDSAHPELEGAGIVARIDAAMGELVARKLIVTSRIGAIGHSRTGYQVLYSITHPGCTHVAAAAVLDSYNGSYAAYLGDAALSGFGRSNFEGSAGGVFWAQKERWLSTETSFNVDRVRTPLLLAQHGATPLDSSANMQSGFLQLAGAFNLNRKPLELVWLPTGQHTLQRPRERRAEMSTVLAWLQFWLQDRLPSTPERAQRWNTLREQQTRVLSETNGGNSKDCESR